MKFIVSITMGNFNTCNAIGQHGFYNVNVFFVNWNGKGLSGFGMRKDFVNLE